MVGPSPRRRSRREPSLLECALLGLLRQAPRSGYDLRRIFAETPFVHFSDSPGAVYPALRRLESRGLVVSVGAGGGRGRRPARLTPAGRGALERWLRAPVTPADLARPLDGTMLRFAFTEEVLGRAACLTFLDGYEAALDAHVAGLEAYAARHMKTASLSGRLAFACGLEGFKARRAWARRARRALAEVEP